MIDDYGFWSMSGHCNVCNQRIYVDRQRNVSLAVETFTARHHGLIEQLEVSDQEIAACKQNNPPVRLMRWSLNLFKDYATPDMIELVAYNQGILPWSK